VDANLQRQIVGHAASLLKDSANRWYLNEVRAGRVPATWQEFETAVIARFEDRNQIDKFLGQMKNLRQTGSVKKYNEQIEDLFIELEGVVGQQQRYNYYLQGLKENLRQGIVLATNVTTYEQAAALAEKLEGTLKGWTSDRPQSHTHKHHGDSNGAGPQPMDLGQINLAGPQPSINAMQGRQVAGAWRKQAKGKYKGKPRRCWNCNQEGHFANKCPNPPATEGQGNGKGRWRGQRK
jgi:hypothetical protein